MRAQGIGHGMGKIEDESRRLDDSSHQADTNVMCNETSRVRTGSWGGVMYMTGSSRQGQCMGHEHLSVVVIGGCGGGLMKTCTW